MQGAATQAMCDIVEDPARSAGPPPRPAGRQARQYLISYAALSAASQGGNAAAEYEVIFARALRWEMGMSRVFGRMINRSCRQVSPSPAASANGTYYSYLRHSWIDLPLGHTNG
jgi:hypothetical protein